MSENQIKLNLDEIPKQQLDSLCRALVEACKKFYSDPQNVEKYEKWKAEQDKKTAKED